MDAQKVMIVPEVVVEKLLHMKEKIYLQKQLITFQSVYGNKLKYPFDFGEASYSMTNFGTVAYDAESKTGSFDMYFASSGFDGL